MRSAEIARLAGVTVRTLRHYHQVGVLAEPPRTSNGYREYSVTDLVRLLRIRQLSSLGMPLDQMDSVLDDVETDGLAQGQYLDDLDQELLQQIQQLTAQRKVIAHLRAHQAAPDLPAELVPFYPPFDMAGYPERVAQMDRDQAILWSHFSDETGKAYLMAVYQKLSEDSALLASSADISRRFEALDSTSSEAQIAELVDDFTAFFAELDSPLTTDDHPTDLGRAAELLDKYSTETYNPQQRKALSVLAQRFSQNERP
ncbi:MerR family transcriptional regulator [Nesterenkonia xinjiangensis]|uniref:DNA-binding transcriptional MerR regulator n=1 Tax=Nesterenkonia xinjiangensis TaxID=225327 RepID=A0A7Z0GP66_9MICC|nr:MerR family transcriptional regulator [Nesterenkonia xinjiangensis]NYJ79343.1 DNA-binding transcriptional MerR regulator [Nesterenkonia xinjiangensis]